ncbi:MAG: hypothetical protein V4722_28090 [Bacteroidota bacterium]
MKTRNHIVAGILLLVVAIATGCNFHNRRIRTVRVENDHSSLRIKYSGKIIFSEDQTEIEHISRNGFVHYKKDGKTFVVKSNDGGDMTYTIYDGHRRLHYQDEDAKAFVSEAVKEIAEHY